MNLSLLLQQCPACLVRLIWMVFEMGGFVGCCLQYLFNILFYKITLDTDEYNFLTIDTEFE